ncbi:MAG: hypothetical protein OHK0019_30770 [Saprospiraceae bacterium]
MKTIRLLQTMLLAGLLLPFISSSQPQPPDTLRIFGLLQQFDPLVVRIETDLKQLVSEKADKIWQPAIFKVMRGDSVALRLDVQVTARGNMRRKTCAFPPVKIRFYKQEPENDSIAELNELKVVTSCNYLAKNEEWVKREYLLYELFNLITDQSFRVQSAKISFDEPGKNSRDLESFSFFIESEEELAARLGGKPIKPRVGSTRALDSVSYDRMCLFEYMIGNTDWSVRARHNIKTIYLKTSTIAVPYDFDYSGAVGTDYAVPNGDYPIQTVQDRYYLGLCRTPAHYQSLFDFYLSKEQAILEHCEQASYLPSESRSQMARYLRRFFETLKNPTAAKREIVQNCNKGR